MTRPFIIVCFLKNYYLYLFTFSICSSYFHFYNFLFLWFSRPLFQKKKSLSSFSFFHFRLCIVKVGKKVQFKFLDRKNPKNNYGKIMIIINYGKIFTYSYLGSNKYFKSSQSSMYVCITCIMFWIILRIYVLYCIHKVKFSSLYFKPNFRS